MTTVTPDHDSGFCHAASENRRRILEELRNLAVELENCENEIKEQTGIQSGACGLPCNTPCGNPECDPCSKEGHKTLERPQKNNNGRRGNNGLNGCPNQQIRDNNERQVICCEVIKPSPQKNIQGGQARCGGVGAALQRRNSFSKPAVNGKSSQKIVPVRCGGNTKLDGYKGSPPGRRCGAIAGKGMEEFAGDGPEPTSGHRYENKYIKPDPSKMPLITYPIYPPIERRPRTPPERVDLTKRSESRELIGGNLLSWCDCTRRNGLQDQCKRPECQGNPNCLVKPEPQCYPSQNVSPRPATKGPKPEKRKPQPVANNPVQICCKCPADCSQKKQKMEEKIKQQAMNCQKHQQNQPTEELYCCYQLRDCAGQTFKGQFEKTLNTMEIDPQRGPLLNR